MQSDMVHPVFSIFYYICILYVVAVLFLVLYWLHMYCTVPRLYWLHMYCTVPRLYYVYTYVNKNGNPRLESYIFIKLCFEQISFIVYTKIVK